MAVFRIIPNQPIPNNPFYSQETDAINRPSGPVIVGEGLSINYATGVISGASVAGNVSVVFPLIDTGTPTAPIIGIAPASTTQSGSVQLVNTTDNPAVDLALTAAMGKYLQDQITALSVAPNISLAGTLDASAGVLTSVTSGGSSAGFIVGSNIPPASATNLDYFVIVTEDGVYTPPGGVPTTCTRGDWFLSDGAVWQFLDVGATYPPATTTSLGIVELATQAEAEAKTDSTLAVTPATLQNFVLCTSLTKGQLLTGTATPGLGCILPYTGAVGSTLTIDPAQPSGLAWCAPAPVVNAIPCACLTSKGSIITASTPGVPTALPSGSDGYVLTSCSACTTGLTWTPSYPPASGIPCNCLTSRGALITAETPNIPLALPVGLNGCVLTACSTCLGAMYWGPTTSAVPATPFVEGIVFGCTDTSSSNTYLGADTGANISGLRNTAIGYLAGCGAGSSGNDNVMVGGRTAMGSFAFENVALGYCSGTPFSNTCNSVFLGSYAGLNRGSGTHNIAIGTRAANSALGGSTGSIAIGCEAGMFSNSESISIGSLAGCSASLDSISIGRSSGWGANICSVSVGYGAGCNSGESSVSIGMCSGFGVGFGSVAVGGFSGQGFLPRTTYVGYGAGQNETGSAGGNVGVGHGSSVLAGDNSISIGCCSGYESGVCAISVGTLSAAKALSAVAIGPEAITYGTFGIAIGRCAQATGICSVVIGANASSAGPSSATIQVGTGVGRFFTFLTPGAAWEAISDARDKTNVEDLALGLNLISDIQPRSFVWQPRAEGSPLEGCRSHGFIAQEVLATLEKHDAKYTGIVSEANPEQLTMAAEGFMPIVINALKELASEVEKLKAEIASLKNS